MQVELKNHVPGVHDASIVEHPKWLKLQNSLYKCGVVVLIKYDEMSPVFGKVDIIVLRDHSFVLFSVQKYSTLQFNVHYNSFIVQLSGRVCYTSLDNLACHWPLSVKSSFSSLDNNLYISLPFMY